jgi:hypothetical protein
MKRLILATAALALASCDRYPPPASPTTVAVADTVVLTGARAFAAAELTYTTAANGVGRFVDAGLIKGATATKVRGWNAQARTLLVKGKATADAAEKARAAASLFGLADNLNTLIGSK